MNLLNEYTLEKVEKKDKNFRRSTTLNSIIKEYYKQIQRCRLCHVTTRQLIGEMALGKPVAYKGEHILTLVRGYLIYT